MLRKGVALWIGIAWRNPSECGGGICRNTRHVRGDTLSTICKEFGLKKDSSDGSIVDRVKKQLLKDKQFRKKWRG